MQAVHQGKKLASLGNVKKSNQVRLLGFQEEKDNNLDMKKPVIMEDCTKVINKADCLPD